MMGKSNHTGLDLASLSHIIQWETISSCESMVFTLSLVQGQSVGNGVRPVA